MKFGEQVAKLAKIGLAAAIASLMATSQAQETVKVGVILSVSGPAAAFGIPERDTVQVFIDKYNAESKARKLEIVFHDEQTNPTEAARGATKLIQQDKVGAIPRSSRPENLRANIEIFDFELTSEEMAAVHGLASGYRISHFDWAPVWDQSTPPREEGAR